MKISDMFKEKRAVYSFETFPPKPTTPIEDLYPTLAELAELKPDYISVTCGAGGSVGGNRTVEVASLIRNRYGTEALAHLTTIGNGKREILEYLEAFERANIENILALRGDRRPDVPDSKDFTYASDLVAFIREHGDFDICGGCYPEGHAECDSEITDILNLRKKVDAGASHLNSQLFFDNGVFYEFMNRCVMAGINVPIQAGIMPIVKTNQIQRIIMLSGTQIPTKFAKLISKYGNDEASLREAGIDYAISQIDDLLDNGVSGIHLYIMNNGYVAKRITDAVKPRIDGINS